MSEMCAMTEYVNCKYGERDSVCITHDRRGPSGQSTKPQPYIPLAQRRKKHEHKPRAPKLPKLIFRTLVNIGQPQYSRARLPHFDLGMKRFVRMARKHEPQTQGIYTTIVGVAKPGSGIEIKDRNL